MTTKTKPRPRTAVTRTSVARSTVTRATKARSASALAGSPEPLNEMWQTPAVTQEERLTRIQTLGQRIEGYIRFMCAVDRLPGTSAEAKEKSVAIFYDRLYLFEQELCRIQEALRLG